MPDNWRSKIGVASQDVKDDDSPPQREASPAPAFHEPVPVYAVCHRFLEVWTWSSNVSLLGASSDCVFDDGRSSLAFFSVPLYV
jgi:hypothetical protein